MSAKKRMIVTAYRSGMSLSQAGAVSGVSKAWAHKVVRELAPELLTGPRPGGNEERDAKIVAAYRGGKSLRDVAAIFDMPRGTVQTIVKRDAPEIMRPPNMKNTGDSNDHCRKVRPRPAAKASKAKKPDPAKVRAMSAHAARCVKPEGRGGDNPPASPGRDGIRDGKGIPTPVKVRKGGWNNRVISDRKPIPSISDDDAIRIFLATRGATQCPPRFCEKSQAGG